METPVWLPVSGVRWKFGPARLETLVSIQDPHLFLKIKVRAMPLVPQKSVADVTSWVLFAVTRKGHNLTRENETEKKNNEHLSDVHNALAVV